MSRHELVVEAHPMMPQISCSCGWELVYDYDAGPYGKQIQDHLATVQAEDVERVARMLAYVNGWSYEEWKTASRLRLDRDRFRNMARAAIGALHAVQS